MISQKEFQDQYYKRALKARGIIKKAFDDAFQKCDVIVSAAVPKLPHKIGKEISPLDMYSYDLLTIPANLSGVCAGSVPVGKVNDIPVGMQVHAPILGEETLLKFMSAVEERV